MEKSELKIDASIKTTIADTIKNNDGVNLVSLNTQDGFHLVTVKRQRVDLENDKLAAIASTMCAMSHSLSQQLLQGELDLAIVESNTGNALFASTHYNELNCVLCIAADLSLPLGRARFLTQRLAEQIESHVLT